MNWPLKAGDLFNFLPVMVTDLISQIAMRINWRVVNRQYLINLVTADHQLTNKSASISSKYLGSQCMVMGLYHWLWIMGSKRWKLRTQDNIIILLQTCSWPNALLIVHILTDILKYRNWSYFSKWTQNWISLINTDFSLFFCKLILSLKYTSKNEKIKRLQSKEFNETPEILLVSVKK